MALSTSLRKTASKLMTKFGGEVTFRRVTTGAYNPTTGTATPSVATSTVRGVLEDVREREINDLIKSTDKKLTLAAADLSFEPAVSDQVTVGGRAMQIVQVNKIEQDNTAIVFEAFLRE
jgi:hypothetical protein